MEADLARLRLANEENEPVRDHDEVQEVDEDFRLCLVGKARTNSAVHFPSLRNVLDEIWHPIEG